MKMLVGVLTFSAVVAGGILAAAIALPREGDDALATGEPVVGSTALGTKRGKTPSKEERRLIEEANLVLEAVDGATFQVIARILERGSGGAVQSVGDRMEVGRLRRMSLASSIKLRMDLDEPASDGSDSYPGASGVLLVDAKGTLTGDEYDGIGIYDVRITRETPAVYRDEAKRRTLRAPPGPGLRFRVTIAWNAGDPEEWTVSWASEAARVGVPLTLKTEGMDHKAVISGELYETGMVGMKGKKQIVQSNVSGFRQVVLTDKEGQNTVRIDVESVDRVALSVNGNRFGPHTARELDSKYGTRIRHLLMPEPEMRR